MRLRSTAALVAVVVGASVAATWADAMTVKLEGPSAVVQSYGWSPLLEISRHGRRLDGFRPVVEIHDGAGKLVVPAKQVGPGVYKVNVVFPHPGEYTYQVKIGRRYAMHGALRVFPG